MSNRSRRCRPGLLLLLVLVLTLSGGVTPPSSPSGSNPFLGPERINDLRVGRFYRGGTRVRSPSLGVSFVVPREWRIRLPAGSQVVHMDSATKPGIGILLLLDGFTPEDVESRLSEPQAFEEAYVLDPTGPVVQRGSRLFAAYLRGTQVGRAVAVLGPANRAALYLVAGPEEEARYYEDLLDGLAESTRFVSFETANLLKEWYGRLSGMMLTRDQDGEGRRSVEWHLCSAGTFLHRVVPSRGAVEAPDATGFQESGTWRIEVERSELKLVVTAQHALPRVHALRVEGGATYLDERPFLRRVSDRCL